MYRIIEKKITKTAGVKLPEDPKSWPAEILKALVNQHPYVDESKIKIKFMTLEPDNAHGVVVLGKSAGIPFTVRKGDKGKKTELDPLDILYDGEQFKAMSEQSYLENTGNSVGTLVDKEDAPTNRSKYVGHYTGDTTPLEWSRQGGGHGQGMAVTAGAGLLSYVIKNQDDVAKMFQLLDTYTGINSALNSLGLRDTLENLKWMVVDQMPDKNRLVHITKREDGGFAINFEKGDPRAISVTDLKSALGSKFNDAMRSLAQRGWVMIRDFPTLRAVDCKGIDVLPVPVETGGAYILIDSLTGKKQKGYVFSDMIDFDGSTIKNQKAVLSDGRWDEGKSFVGFRAGENPNDFPIGEPKPGTIGMFIDESWGSLKCTPAVMIEKVIEMPGQLMLIVKRFDTGARVGLINGETLIRPHAVPEHRRPTIMPRDNTYYMPDHMSFAELGERVNLSDKVKFAAKKAVQMKKNAGMYNLSGYVEDELVDWRRMSPWEARQKLASLGANDDVIDSVMNLREGQSKELRNLQNMLTKESSQIAASIPKEKLEIIKEAARESLQALNESEEAQDANTIDTIMSLQFISDETLHDLVGAQELFEECEDKLARLLLAARQGEKSINEKGIQKALKGLAKAKESLMALATELDNR